MNIYIYTIYIFVNMYIYIQYAYLYIYIYKYVNIFMYIYIYNGQYIQYVSIHFFEITSQKNFRFKLTVGECLVAVALPSPEELLRRTRLRQYVTLVKANLFDV